MKSLMKYCVKYSKDIEISKEKTMTYQIGYAACGTALLILIWFLGGSYLFSQPGYEQFNGFLPIPTLKALFKLIVDIGFWSSVYASIKRVTLGIMIAFVLGLPFGLLTGFYKRLNLLTHTSVQFLRMISPISWMPIALLVFDSFESAICFLITIATIWPIILTIANGVSRVNVQWIKMAQNQGANDFQLLLFIILPASIPYILNSLRLAVGIAWIILVPAEFLGISSGLGYIINDARDTMEYDRLMAIVIAIGIIGFILDGVIQLVQLSLNWIWIEWD
ncbi:MAG: ABC transporter permease [Desulfobacterales bacterium]|nr:ABC transporter permease [Desulfobacterales bacterium]